MARLSRFGVIMFFRKDPPQTEGRRDADLLIKTENVAGASLATAQQVLIDWKEYIVIF